MSDNRSSGHAFGKILRVNLSDRKIDEEVVDVSSARKYVGGVGLGAHYLYREVAPGIGWADPDNRLIFASGPLGGTPLAGTGCFCVVTKGALTNGATSTQANGYFGAYLRFSGFDAVVVEGAADDWVYLYIHDGRAELREARQLLGKDTWQTGDAIKAELGKKGRELSVFGIGPAGENKVRFAGIVGDEGHAAAHNGVGAVMGSKRLKAIVAAKGRDRVRVSDPERFAGLAKKMIENTKQHPLYGQTYKWGTSCLLPVYARNGVLPVKNLTTNIFDEAEVFSGERYRSRHKLKWNPCWACPMRHCHLMKITEGPYAGYEGEEPEYEGWAAFSSLIGQSDLGAAFMLNDVVDRLGMDANEAGWMLAFVMECYERGIIRRDDLRGIEMNWGNAEGSRALLHLIAGREGFGEVLAEGVMRAARHIGGEALDVAVFMQKGHAPRSHDHRARWTEILDYATSGTGTIETGPLPVADPFSPELVAATVAQGKIRLFVDSLVVCMFPTMMMTSNDASHLVDLLNAATGWDFTNEEAGAHGLRIANLLRVFNLRQGIGPEVEMPSARYGSAPVDGPVAGKSIMPVWNQLREHYYRQMGWDLQSGIPFIDTLRAVRLEDIVPDTQALHRMGCRQSGVQKGP